MRITEARYVNGEEVTVIALNQMTVRSYENHYKGKLFCPTPACTARISFCAGPTPYYKTWKLDNHLDRCIHKFDRIPIKRGTTADEVISVDIGRKRRNDALSAAYKFSLMSDEEKIQLQERRRASRRSKQKTTGDKKVIKPSVQTTLFGGEEEEKLKIRGRNIMKRDVDRITKNDVGEIRLVTGYVEKLELVDSVATFYVGKNGAKIKVTFEEAFIAEPENNAFLNNFHVPKGYIERKEERKEETIFNGIGEIRMKENQLMLAVYHGNDFRFDGHNMLALNFV